MKPFIIKDWAGNRIGNKGFKTFEDGWEYILGEMTDTLGLTEEDYQEYFVERGEDRESCYLVANDIRTGSRKTK